MYTFIIKDNSSDLDIIVTRSILALAAITAMVYSSDQFYYLNLAASATLFIAAMFIKLLLVKLRIHKLILLSGAAVVLFIATHSVAFAIILVAYGYLVKFLYRKPTIEVTGAGIIIRKRFVSPSYQWNEFSNIILKDSLLTLDFKNNKLIQVSIEENEKAVDETTFNDFCKGFM